MAKSNNRPHKPVTLPGDFGVIPNVYALPSAIRITPYLFVDNIFAIINPYLAFLLIPSLMDFCALREIQLNSTAENNIFRQTLISQPGLFVNAVRPNVEEQIITNNVTSKVVQDSSRERSQFQLALTAYIWILSFLVACAPPELRSEFITRVQSTGYVPTIFVEQFKRIRRSRCGGFMITPVLMKGCCGIFLRIHKKYRGTYLDTKVLFTPGGLQSLCEFFSFMSKVPGNYIPLTKVDVNTLPELDAGYTTRFNAIGVLCNNLTDYRKEITNYFKVATKQLPPYNPWFNQNIYLINGNSYGPSVESVHMADAHIVQQVHSANNGISAFLTDPNYLAFETANVMFEISATAQSIGTHIVYRVLGIIPNSYNPTPDKKQRTNATNQSTSRDSSSADTATPVAFNSGELLGLLRSFVGNDFLKLLHAFNSIVNNKKLLRKFYAIAS